MRPTDLPEAVFGRMGLVVLLIVGIVTWPFYTLYGVLKKRG